MKKSVSLISAIIATIFASPAFADDAAVDVDSIWSKRFLRKHMMQ